MTTTALRELAERRSNLIHNYTKLLLDVVDATVRFQRALKPVDTPHGKGHTYDVDAVLAAEKDLDAALAALAAAEGGKA